MHKYGALGSVWTADVTAHLDRALGQDTAEQWALVVEGWETLGAPIEAALAALRLAERLAQDGQRGRATATASGALATAERIGAHRTRRPDPCRGRDGTGSASTASVRATTAHTG